MVAQSVATVWTVMNIWGRLRVARDEAEKAKQEAVLARQRAESAEAALSGLREPRVPSPSKFTSALVIGIGDSGKSELIKRLRVKQVGDPHKTLHVETYRIAIQDGELNNDVFLTDYVGQNLGSLIRSFVESQREPYSPLRYGYINALILVVDVAPADGIGLEGFSLSHEVAQKRVARQLAEWNHQALSAVFGMLTSGIRYVCLFVNKCDLLPGNAQERAHAVTEVYRPLVEQLRRRTPTGTEVEIMAGSTVTGALVPELAAKLRLVGEDLEQDIEARRRPLADHGVLNGPTRSATAGAP